MKSLGIIGGIAPESTIAYYRSIIASFRARTHDGGYPSLIINSIDLKKMLDLIGANRLDAVTGYLLEEIEKLACAGAEFGLLASNTPHIVFENIRRDSPIPLISIVEATRNAARAMNLKKVALVGTRFTMRGDFYPDVFSEQGIEVIAPEPDDLEYIHQVYIDELINGIFLDDTRKQLLAVVDRMIERNGIHGVILGGTELPLILENATHRDIPLLNTSEIHVEEAVTRML